MKRIVLLALLLLLSSSVQAQTLRNCTIIDDKTTSGSATGAIVEFKPQNYRARSAVITWANTAGTTPTLDVELQSCRTTQTSSCQDWPTSSQIFTQKTGSLGTGVQVVDINAATVNNWKYFRAVSVVGGTASPLYTYRVELCVDGTSN